jgi:hypothetical protein
MVPCPFLRFLAQKRTRHRRVLLVVSVVILVSVKTEFASISIDSKYQSGKIQFHKNMRLIC